VTSQLVKLELLPKPAFFKQQAELDFYQTHFSMVKAEEELSEELGRDAFRLAQQYGVSAADALHLAAAFRLKAVEFVTSELPGKPMFRVPGIKITSIHRAH
jgi:predicted nucleic acid-binding protein